MTRRNPKPGTNLQPYQVTWLIGANQQINALDQIYQAMGFARLKATARTVRGGLVSIRITWRRRIARESVTIEQHVTMPGNFGIR